MDDGKEKDDEQSRVVKQGSELRDTALQSDSSLASGTRRSEEGNSRTETETQLVNETGSVADEEENGSER